jgi:MFS transporter, PPP family, 3-phenylpropionic acid transporter
MTALPPPNHSLAATEKSFYFFYYAASASLFPFLGLHYEQLGFAGHQIGLLAGLPPILTLLGASLWGGIADATGQHQRVLFLAIAASIAAVATLSVATSFAALCLAVVFMAFSLAPITPLVDNTVMRWLGPNQDGYGRIRLWGAVGWGCLGPLMGWLVDQAGLAWSFYGFVAWMLACLLVSLRLPVADKSIGGALGQGLLTVIRDRRWRLFLFLAFVAGVGLGAVHHFLFLYMNHIGASRTLMGLSLSVATLSEMVVFFFAGRLLRRWGAKRLLIFATLAIAARPLAYSFVQVPEWVLAVQLLHGPSFALLWVAGVSYANHLAPTGLGATAQGLFSGVNFGLGGAMGALCGGVLYEYLGPLGMYRWAGISVFGGLLLFTLVDTLVDRLKTPSN